MHCFEPKERAFHRIMIECLLFLYVRNRAGFRFQNNDDHGDKFAMKT